MTIAAIFPHIEPCIPALHKAAHRYDLTTANRQAAFIAQCGHESAGFTRFAENLNYSADGLVRTWPNRFPKGVAVQYAHKPQAIANRAYALRYGNGNEASGDGWHYRGRGAIQMTFKANYEGLARKLGMSLEQTVAYLETTEGAIMSAGQFWSDHHLNVYADAGNLLAMTKAINGGTNGLQERVNYYGKVRVVLLKEGLL